MSDIFPASRQNIDLRPSIGAQAASLVRHVRRGPAGRRAHASSQAERSRREAVLQPVGFQAVTEGVAKDGKSQPDLPSFSVRKAVFRNAVCRLLQNASPPLAWRGGASRDRRMRNAKVERARGFSRQESTQTAVSLSLYRKYRRYCDFLS